MKDLESRLPVFVYGTLRQGQSNYSRYLEGRVEQSQAAYLEGAELYHFEAYPGLRLVANLGNHRVQGELMYPDKTHYSEIIADLDILEGCDVGLYERIQTTVKTILGHEILAWVYVMGPPLLADCTRLIESGDWLQEPAEAEFVGVRPDMGPA